MLFTVLIVSIAVGNLLALGAALYIMTRPKVIETYMNWINKMTEKMIEKL